MQLDPNLFARFQHRDRVLGQLATAYANFVSDAKRLSEADSPIRGVVISMTEANSFSASYATAKVAFRFLVQQADNDSLRGKIVCTLEEPIFGERASLLGFFTFNAQGIADLQGPAGSDPIDLNVSAKLVVLHFIELALKHPQP